MKHLIDKKMGIIVPGNIAGATMHALLKAKELPPENILASDPSKEQCEYIAEQYRIHVTSDNRETVDGADIVFSETPSVKQSAEGAHKVHF